MNLRAGTISGGHTWPWMGFDLMMSITRKIRRSRNVTQKRFRVISNIIDSRKHGTLGIGLKKLRSLRIRLGFHVGLTHGKSLKTSNIEAQLFHFDWVWYVRGLLFTDTYLNILFSKSNYWNYAVFQWSDARLTSAGIIQTSVNTSSVVYAATWTYLWCKPPSTGTEMSLLGPKICGCFVCETTITWSSISRRNVPIYLSTNGFCHGLRYAVSSVKSWVRLSLW